MKTFKKNYNVFQFYGKYIKMNKYNMRSATLKTYIVLFALTFVMACSKDDDDTPTINAIDFSTTVDENPADNASLGTISAAGTGALTYSITSQIPNGALSINSITGELKVADASLFDFETNPNIDAVITILNTEATTTVNATINLNDVDDIASFLSTSKTAYTNGSNGDWIEITEIEYNNLASKLNEVTKVATSDSEYNFADTVTASAPDFTIANDNGYDIPNASYTFAFKYNAQVDATTNSKVLISDDTVSGTFSQLGNVLPSSTTGDQFYVIKGNSSITNGTGYLGFYNSTRMGLKTVTGSGNYAFESNEATDLSQYYTNVTVLYQGLTSTQKQWD